MYGIGACPLRTDSFTAGENFIEDIFFFSQREGKRRSFKNVFIGLDPPLVQGRATVPIGAFLLVNVSSKMLPIFPIRVKND